MDILMGGSPAGCGLARDRKREADDDEQNEADDDSLLLLRRSKHHDDDLSIDYRSTHRPNKVVHHQSIMAFRWLTTHHHKSNRAQARRLQRPGSPPAAHRPDRERRFVPAHEASPSTTSGSRHHRTRRLCRASYLRRMAPTSRGGRSSLSTVDLFRRMPVDLTETTALGGLLSICAG